jgi:hypothetical protein
MPGPSLNVAGPSRRLTQMASHDLARRDVQRDIRSVRSWRTAFRIQTAAVEIHERAAQLLIAKRSIGVGQGAQPRVFEEKNAVVEDNSSAE